MRPMRRVLLPVGVFLGVLPGAVVAVLLPDLLASPPSPSGLLLWRTALALPIVMLPLLLAFTRLQRHQSRTAVGLGAQWLDRLRWLWLPQLGLGIIVSLLLAGLFAMLFTSGGIYLRRQAGVCRAEPSSSFGAAPDALSS